MLGSRLHWDVEAMFELHDLNGDNVLDIVGRVHTYESSGLVINYVGYDGANGKQLWITPSFGEFSDEVSSVARVIGDTLLVSDSHGQLHGHTLAEGKRLWIVDLGEHVDRICEGDVGEATIVTKDEISRTVTLADGKIRLTAPGWVPIGCETPRVKGSYGYGPMAIGYGAWSIRESDGAPPAPSGTKLSHGFAGPGALRVGLGVKAPGSPVPIVAVYEGDELLWSSVVPEGDLLAAATGPTNLALLYDDLLVLSYESADDDNQQRLSARDITTGVLRWSVLIPHSGKVSSTPSRLITDGQRLYIPHWVWLEALDLHTGESLYSIGRWL